MPNLKPYYQVKLTLLRCKLSFLENLPKNEDEQYAYDIIQKAYEINEKNIEMLDFVYIWNAYYLAIFVLEIVSIVKHVKLNSSKSNVI